MLSLQKLSSDISNKIGEELNFDKDKIEVIAYGTFALLQMLISIIILIIIGNIFNVLIEALIISFTTSILRKYSGGVHASSPRKCILLGSIICIGQALAVKFIFYKYIDLNIIFILGLIIFIWSYYMIYKLAPVDSLAKPIKTQNKRNRMKKGSILILNIYILISIMNIILYYELKYNCFIIYTLCIYMSITWQIFTLTNVAHLILNK